MQEQNDKNIETSGSDNLQPPKNHNEFANTPRILSRVRNSIDASLKNKNANPIASIFKLIAIGLSALTILLWLLLIETLPRIINPISILIILVLFLGFVILLIYAVGEIIQLLQDIKDNTNSK